MSPHPGVLTRAPDVTAMLARPRLTDAVGEASLVVIVGPAGSGKSVLALQTAGLRSRRSLYCRLAPGHDRAVDLTEMLLPPVSQGADPAGQVRPDPLALADGLLTVVEQQPTDLVIEDYHHGLPEDCDPLLADVVSLLPPQSRVILTTRRRPTTLLGTVGRDAVAMVDADSLAFTPHEAAQLLELPEADVDPWMELTGGWATALAVAAMTEPAPGVESPGADPTVITDLLHRHLDAAQRRAMDMLAVLPYLDPATAAAVAVPSELLDDLVDQTALVSKVDGVWLLNAAAREAIGRHIDASDRESALHEGAPILARSDPAAAVEILVLHNMGDLAAELLAANLSRLGADSAASWLYRLPPELRRGLPPVLSGGRATVNVNDAMESARGRLRSAATEQDRRESLLGLGSALTAGGHLAEASAVLEDAVAAAGASPELGRRAQILLAMVRWWSGDLEGADHMARQAHGPWSHWTRAQVALARGDLDAAGTQADEALVAAEKVEDVTAAPGLATKAQIALARSDLAAAEPLALDALEVGSAAGGHDEACGLIALAWVRVVTGDADAAQPLCDRLERRLARHDAHARMHVALIRLALDLSDGDVGAIERSRRRVRDHRRLGFAAVEAVAAGILPSLGDPEGPLLVVDLLGAGKVHVTGTTIGNGDWKSRKALEVLRFIAAAGSTGTSRERTIEAVWPDREPEKGRTLLRTALSEIRRRLEPDRPRGEPSRFLLTDGDLIRINGITDLDEVDALVDVDNIGEAFGRLAAGPTDMGDGDWAAELERDMGRRLTTAAESVAEITGDDPVGASLRRQALDVLIEREPWQRVHYDRLAALHRGSGDDAAARAVERRWFEED